MFRVFVATLAAAAAAVSVPTLANDLVEAGETVEVARSEMSVTPDVDWNILDARPGRRAERWTQDGEQLNDVKFFAVRDEEVLVREEDRRNRPLPKFQASMLPIDIPRLLENTHRVADGVAIFTMTSSEPFQFGGQAGIRFTYEFVGPDELRRNGEAAAVIQDGVLYMASYEAPTIYYFDRYLANFRQLVSSTVLPD